MGRRAGTMATGLPGAALAGGGTATVVVLNAGMNFDTGSFRRSLPSSSSIIAATLVTAFDIEAMRKIASFCISGGSAHGPRAPRFSKYATRPSRTTIVTVQATVLATYRFIVSESRASRAGLSPTVSGRTAGSACACATPGGTDREQQNQRVRANEAAEDEHDGGKCTPPCGLARRVRTSDARQLRS